MGREVPGTSGLPISLKVKNTFIDVHSSFMGVDEDGPLFQDTAWPQRQVSEPTPSFQRQISGASQWRSSDARPSSLAPGALPANLRFEESEEHGDEPDDSEREEPETETEPTWFLGRQETEQAWPSAGSTGPQADEQLWNQWGFQPGSQSIEAAGSQIEPMLVQPAALVPNMWLCQLPAYAETQGPSRDSGNVSVALAPPWPGAPASAGAAMAAAAAAAAAPPAESLQLAAAQVAAQLPGASGAPAPPPEWAGTTTVMMRNLPNKYTQHMLLEELNQSGFLGSFDFLYLPIDPETSANRGYAFINFTDPGFAWMLKMAYEGRRMCRFNSDKVVSIAPAALQGFEANYAHYSTARVSRGDPAARPLFLRESTLQHTNLRHEGRRRGGRRNQGSLIDLAARQQQQQQQHRLAASSVAQAQRQQPPAAPSFSPPSAGPASALPPGAAATYVGLDGHPGGLRSQGTSGNAVGKRTAARGESPLVPQFCPYCGGRCQPQFKFCQFCGAALGFTPGA